MLANPRDTLMQACIQILSAIAKIYEIPVVSLVFRQDNPFIHLNEKTRRIIDIASHFTDYGRPTPRRLDESI